MIDYSKCFKCADKLILGYEIKNNNLVVHYSKGDDYVLPYSKEAEELVLIFMKNQVVSLYDKYLILLSKHNNFNNYFFSCVSVISLVYSVLGQEYLSVLPAFGFAGLSLFRSRSYAKEEVVLRDYEKNKFYIDNEKYFLKQGISINDLDRYDERSLSLMIKR